MPWFDVVGPVEMKRGEQGTKTGRKKFWADAIYDPEYKELKTAIGCYLFCIRHGENYKPWYVGMTVAKTGFGREIFQPHKQAIYENCLTGHAGTPVWLILPLIADGDNARFSRARGTGAKTIFWLERTLTGMAYARNRDLSNIKDMHHYKNIEVAGIMGTRDAGRPYTEITKVRRALFGT